MSFLLSLSCAPDLNDVVEDWKKEGWTIVRTHGVKQDFDRTGTLMSKKAQAVEASWLRMEKEKQNYTIRLVIII